MGTRRMADVLMRIVRGEGQPDDLTVMEALCAQIPGSTLCPLGDAAVNPVLSSMKHFRDEYEYHIEFKQCKEDWCYGQNPDGR